MSKDQRIKELEKRVHELTARLFDYATCPVYCKHCGAVNWAKQTERTIPRPAPAEGKEGK